MKNQPLPNRKLNNYGYNQSTIYFFFSTRMEELKTYVERHGHMNVTKNENKTLYNSIQNIRGSYKKMKEGQSPHTKLTPDRMKMLQQIGFEWEHRFHRVSVPFESHVEALKRYRTKHGHTRVTVKEDRSLHSFVPHHMKHTMINGKRPASLTPDRITALEELGLHIR